MTPPSRLLITAALATTALLTLPSTASSQAAAWPTKTVRILTPFPAGAGPETVARVLAEKLQRRWGKPVIVENRPGGNGFIAISEFLRGDKDGHDLIQLDNVHLVAYPYLFKKLPYDPVNDFQLVAPLFKASFFFAVPTNSPYKTVGDLIADAKAKPGKLNYGSWSVGNPVHLGSKQFETLTGLQMEHVVYKETSMLYTGVANGELAFALGSSGTSGSLQRAGRLRYLAVAGPKRLSAYPDVPTVAESGGPASFEVNGWTAIGAPKGLSPAIVQKIRHDIEQALAEPDITQRYATFGYEVFPATPEQFQAFVKTESARYADVIKKANVSLD
jgi:tripartite-type tricarboxylate transporter receptor subunit TctC